MSRTPIKALQIGREALQAMHEHAERTYPNECCGFFFGKDGQMRQVHEIRPVNNSKAGDQRRRFEISAKDYMLAERHADQIGSTLLGVYHSHPDHPARPSEHDLRQAVPFFSYIIISVEKGRAVNTTSWQLNPGSQFQEEKITVPRSPRKSNTPQ